MSFPNRGEGKGNWRLIFPGITGNGNSRSPLVPIHIHARNFFGHRPSPDGSKMAIIWQFSAFFGLPGHLFGCWDHIYAYDWHQANQKTCHIYRVVVRNHSGISSHPYGAGGVRNMAISGSKSGYSDRTPLGMPF